MSFEGNKAQLIDELAKAQAEIRAKYGMADRTDPLADGAKAKGAKSTESKPADKD